MLTLGRVLKLSKKCKVV